MTFRTPAACLTLVLAIAVGGAIASADDRENASDRRMRALALLTEARTRYDLGRFDEAIDLFEKAYETWPYAEALYNLGQAWRKKKDYERAIFYYKSFLRNKPDAKNRADVETRVSDLEQLIEKQRVSAGKPSEGAREPPSPSDKRSDPRSPAPTPPSGPDLAAMRVGPLAEPLPPWYADSWAWAITGSGVAVGGAAVGFIVSANGLEDDAAGELDQAKRAALQERASGRRTIGTVLMAAGGAGLAIGVVKLAWTSDSLPMGRSTTAVFAPNWVGLQGRF